MNAKPEPLPDGSFEVGSKRKGPWWAPRTLGRLMTVIALSGLAMAGYAHRTRRPATAPLYRVRFLPPGVSQGIPVPRPMDPSILVAPPGIDDAMIVTARSGIDDAMIIHPGRWAGTPAPATPVLPLPGNPSDPQAPGPWRPQPRNP